MLAERYHVQSCDWRKQHWLIRERLKKGFTVLFICIFPDATVFQVERKLTKEFNTFHSYRFKIMGFTNEILIIQFITC